MNKKQKLVAGIVGACLVSAHALKVLAMEKLLSRQQGYIDGIRAYMDAQTAKEEEAK